MLTALAVPVTLVSVLVCHVTVLVDLPKGTNALALYPSAATVLALVAALPVGVAVSVVPPGGKRALALYPFSTLPKLCVYVLGRMCVCALFALSCAALASDSLMVMGVRAVLFGSGLYVVIVGAEVIVGSACESSMEEDVEGTAAGMDLASSAVTDTFVFVVVVVGAKVEVTEPAVAEVSETVEVDSSEADSNPIAAAAEAVEVAADDMIDEEVATDEGVSEEVAAEAVTAAAAIDGATEEVVTEVPEVVVVVVEFEGSCSIGLTSGVPATNTSSTSNIPPPVELEGGAAVAVFDPFHKGLTTPLSFEYSNS